MTLDIRSPAYLQNPYPVYERLRNDSPICRTQQGGFWVIARHQDVARVLRNPQLFSSSGIGAEPKREIDFLLNNRGMVDADPPAHSRLRGLISKAFTPGMVVALEPRIRAIARSLLAKATQNEAFDLIREFANPLPVIVISELLGIDPGRWDDFQRWAKTLVTWRNTERIQDAKLRQAREEEIERDLHLMLEYFRSVIAEKRSSPGNDLISGLVRVSETEKLETEEILGFVRLLLVAGTETTTNLLGNSVLALLNHPAEWESIQKNPSLIPGLIEETLRFDSPVLALIRRVSADTEFAGVKLAKDEFVLPLLGSANHDSEQFAEPAIFRPGRNATGHMSFGHGIHSCLGAPLARMQVRIAFEEIFTAFDRLEQAESSLEYVESFFFRGPKSLKLKYQPCAATSP